VATKFALWLPSPAPIPNGTINPKAQLVDVLCKRCQETQVGAKGCKHVKCEAMIRNSRTCQEDTYTRYNEKNKAKEIEAKADEDEISPASIE